jgi:hypothetical protein
MLDRVRKHEYNRLISIRDFLLGENPGKARPPDIKGRKGENTKVDKVP